MAAMADLEVELRARCWKSSVYQVGCVICQDPEPECQLRLEAVVADMSAGGLQKRILARDRIIDGLVDHRR